MAYFETRSSRLDVILIKHMLIAPAHIHEFTELVYCREGELDITVAERHYRLQPGDAALIAPLAVHSYNVAENRTVTGIIFIIDPALYPALSESVSEYAPVTPLAAAAGMSGVARYALTVLSNICENMTDADAELKIIAWLGVALTELYSQLPLVRRTTVTSDAIARTISYVQQNYQHPISLKDAAQAVGASPNYLSTLFTRQLCISFHAYLNATRLNHALTLLKHADMSVTEICYDCGFSSLRTFNRLFQAAFHITPLEMRRISSQYPVQQLDTVNNDNFKIHMGYDY